MKPDHQAAVSEVHPSNDAVVVTLHVDVLDLSAQEVFESVLGEQLDAGAHRIVLDLSEVMFCDSSGLSALLRVRRRAQAMSGWLRLTGLSGQPARIIELTNLSRVLPSYADAATALIAPEESPETS